MSALLAFSSISSAGDDIGDFQDVIEPQVERRVITRDDIDSENFELGFYAGLISVEDFAVNPLYGLRLAYHASEYLFLEASYGMADTEKSSAEELGGFVLMTEDQRKLSYYDLSLGYNVLPGEAFVGSSYAFTQALYLIAGIGSVDFAGDERYSISFGLGYRLLFTDWLALHIDTRDRVFDNDILGQEKTTHNLEFHTGLTVFF